MRSGSMAAYRAAAELPDREDPEDGDVMKADWCGYSGWWLLFRAFQPPSNCVDPGRCTGKACEGCDYFEMRETTSYFRRKLERFDIAMARE